MFLRSVKKTQFLLVENKTRKAEVPLLSAKHFWKVKKKANKIQLYNPVSGQQYHSDRREKIYYCQQWSMSTCDPSHMYLWKPYTEHKWKQNYFPLKIQIRNLVEHRWLKF